MTGVRTDRLVQADLRERVADDETFPGGGASVCRWAGDLPAQRHTERSRQHYLTVNPATIPSAAFGTPVLLGERSNAT